VLDLRASSVGPLALGGSQELLAASECCAIELWILLSAPSVSLGHFSCLVIATAAAETLLVCFHETSPVSFVYGKGHKEERNHTREAFPGQNVATLRDLIQEKTSQRTRKEWQESCLCS
jgi:hypothetical protein